MRFPRIVCEFDQCEAGCLVRMSVKKIAGVEDLGNREEVIGVIDRAFHLPS